MLFAWPGALESKSRQDTILTAVDRLAKLAQFIPMTSNKTSKQTAELFLRYMLKYLWVPENVVADRISKDKALDAFQLS